MTGGGRTAPADPRAPCLIGAARRTVRSDAGPAPEPLALWADVCRDAAADSGARRDVLAAVDILDVVYCQSWSYDDPAGRLAEQLGITPRRQRYSGVGGTVPQVLLADSAEAILRGDTDVALVVGGEALATRRALRKAGERPAWSFPEPERSPFPFDTPFHPAEIAHEVFQAWLTFALWDVARRAHLGIAPDDYRRTLGELFAPYTKIAAASPHAWFPVERDADELVRPTATNRMVGYPYTKYLVAVMDVDMAAAAILTSHAAADALGVPPDRRVYLRGWGAANDPAYVAEHDPTWASPAMRTASAAALGMAGIGVDDVAHLDLYSCFTSAVLFACDALGITPSEDGRPLTVTGGLPYYGGPGSGYGLHSLAAMTEVLREDPGSYGLVSGVGMHMTKHAFGIWSTSPGQMNPPATDQAAGPPRPRAIHDVVAGPATVATYTVVHDRAGNPEWGVAVCDLDDGARTYARVEDPDLLTHLETEEAVGQQVELRQHPERPQVNLLYEVFKER